VRTILDIKKIINDHVLLMGYPYEYDTTFTIDCIEDEVDGKLEVYLHIPTKFMEEPEGVDKKIRKLFGSDEVFYIEPCSTYLAFWSVLLKEEEWVI